MSHWFLSVPLSWNLPQDHHPAGKGQVQVRGLSKSGRSYMCSLHSARCQLPEIKQNNQSKHWQTNPMICNFRKTISLRKMTVGEKLDSLVGKQARFNVQIVASSGWLRSLHYSFRRNAKQANHVPIWYETLKYCTLWKKKIILYFFLEKLLLPTERNPSEIVSCLWKRRSCEDPGNFQRSVPSKHSPRASSGGRLQS